MQRQAGRLGKVFGVLALILIETGAAKAADWASLCKQATAAVADMGAKAALEQARALGFSEEQIAYARRECRKFSVKVGRFPKAEEAKAISEPVK